MKKDDCIFCKIANGEIPSATVYETPECRVILDLAPANQGHALILTKEHTIISTSLMRRLQACNPRCESGTGRDWLRGPEYRAEQWRSSWTDCASFPYACDSTSRRG